MLRLFQLLIAFSVSVFSFSAFTAEATSLEQLQQSFMARYDEANATRDESLKKLETNYLGALKRHMDKVKASGRLELVVPVRDEIEAVEGKVDPLPVLPENTSYDLKQLRKKYETARRQVVTDHAEAILDLAEKMTDVLEKQEAELTKAGKIDEALAAKRMSETLGRDAGIQAARERLQAVKRAGKALPALRIRRCGDDLEVIVYYDRNGKVSMDSPVENVRESGEKQGDTNAKVLGEFVGAEGYEVDSYTAMDLRFEKGVPKDVALMGIAARHTLDNEQGKVVGLRYMPQAKNPRGNLGRVLPPEEASSSYVVTCHYRIPQSNKVLSGLRFVSGQGNHVGGRAFCKKGEWAEETIVSKGAGPVLLLYLNRAGDASIKDAVSEEVFIKSLSVEYIRFTAFTVDKLADDSVLLVAGKKVERGSPVVVDGELVLR